MYKEDRERKEKSQKLIHGIEVRNHISMPVFFISMVFTMESDCGSFVISMEGIETR